MYCENLNNLSFQTLTMPLKSFKILKKTPKTPNFEIWGRQAPPLSPFLLWTPVDENKLLIFYFSQEILLFVKDKRD